MLGGLIFFHELGHFLVARAFGMGVSTFSLGFGPKLFKRTYGKTEYCLSAVPLGGYCALVGEDDQSQELPQGFTSKESFALRPAWQRILVVAAGPFANVLLALLICWILAFSYGQAHLLPTVGEVMPDSPAAMAGMQAGDTIISIDGTPIKDWVSMSDAIAASKGTALTVDVDRAGVMQSVNITPKVASRTTVFGEEESTWVIGVRASGNTAHTELGFWQSAGAGAERTWEMVVLTWTGFVKLFQRVVPIDQVGGPIMIAQMVGEQAQQSLANVLALAALISINLAILNLLPIPVLDGGHIVFFLIEMIIGRPVPQKIRTITMQVGIALLIGLMLLSTYNDIARIVKGFWGS